MFNLPEYPMFTGLQKIQGILKYFRCRLSKEPYLIWFLRFAGIMSLYIIVWALRQIIYHLVTIQACIFRLLKVINIKVRLQWLPTDIPSFLTKIPTTCVLHHLSL